MGAGRARSLGLQGADAAGGSAGVCRRAGGRGGDAGARQLQEGECLCVVVAITSPLGLNLLHRSGWCKRWAFCVLALRCCRMTADGSPRCFFLTSTLPPSTCSVPNSTCSAHSPPPCYPNSPHCTLAAPPASRPVTHCPRLQRKRGSRLGESDSEVAEGEVRGPGAHLGKAAQLDAALLCTPPKLTTPLLPRSPELRALA